MSIADDLFAAINTYRVGQGGIALTSDGDLAGVAQLRASLMASTGVFTHYPANGQTFLVLLNQAEYDYGIAGENIEANSDPDGTTVATAMNQFINSPPHRANMLDTDYFFMGVAFAKSATRTYFAVIFASQKGPGQTVYNTNDNQAFNNIGNLANVSEIIWQGLPGVYLATTPAGLFKSVDYGATWGELRPNSTFGTTWPVGARAQQVSFQIGPRQCNDNIDECGTIVIGNYSPDFIGPPRWSFYSPDGTFIKSLIYMDGEAGDFGAGTAFNPLDGNLYAISRRTRQVVVFDKADPNDIIRVIEIPITVDEDSGDTYPRDIVFDLSGNFYIGYSTPAFPGGLIKEFSSSGELVQTFSFTADNIGSDSIDIAADGSLFSSGQNNFVRKNGDIWMEDDGVFTNAIKIIPGENAGILTAAFDNLRRYGPDGCLIGIYPPGDIATWGALALDNNGVSFWAVDFDDPGQFAKFNIATGALEAGPFPTVVQSRNITIACGVRGGNPGPGGCINPGPPGPGGYEATWDSGTDGYYVWDNDLQDWILHPVYCTYSLEVSNNNTFPTGSTTTYGIQNGGADIGIQPDITLFDFSLDPGTWFVRLRTHFRQGGPAGADPNPDQFSNTVTVVN